MHRYRYMTAEDVTYLRARFAGFHHLQHSLALTRMLVAAEIWSGKQEDYKLEITQTAYDLARLREMKQAPLAIPDAWLLFMKKERKYPILLEIDMGSENINKFKEHILARIELIQSGKYEEIFGISAVLISYVGVGESSRLSVMTKWAEDILKEQGLEEWGQIFKIGYVNLSQIYNLNLFTDRIWRQPFTKIPAPLLE